MTTVNPELGFYALAGQPKSPRDLIEELQQGEAMGIEHVEASPLTRSSYHAREAADAAERG